MVDLSTLKIGDSVKFRNGKVKEVIYTDRNGRFHRVLTRYGGLKYCKDGHLFSNLVEDDFDIVEIIPKEDKMVDLSTLKVGDTVVFRKGNSEEVEKIEKLEDDSDFDYFLWCKGFYSKLTKDGFFNTNKEEHLSDVVKIIPKEQPKSNDAVNHPSHYTSGGIECIAAIKASMSAEEYRGYLKGNVLKYLWRYESKGKPSEDLKKARVYLDWLIKEVEE